MNLNKSENIEISAGDFWEKKLNYTINFFRKWSRIIF